MRVILVQDVVKLGDMGEVVKVADGYARNYLIPQGMALPANEQNGKAFRHQLKMIERQKSRLRSAALDLVGQLNDISVTIPRQVGDDDKLYGSVTNRDIEAALATEGFEVDRKKILLDKPIRELGVYRIEAKLHGDVRAHIRVWVTAI